jgi:transcriptional regulator of acetoin/glycerol metabolism|tara:strand:- start:159 stop:533 length:375 start_codon:yes stop_codon:yes gene_type:complete
MPWARKLHRSVPKRYNGTTRDYSVSNRLKKENKITDEFEMMLSSLTLEEVIALRLELASRTVGYMMYGLPLWGSLHNITKDAVLRYVLSASRSRKEAARVLGIDRIKLHKLYKKFDLYNYFQDQ